MLAWLAYRHPIVSSAIAMDGGAIGAKKSRS
jgi:hypothetical protein